MSKSLLRVHVCDGISRRRLGVGSYQFSGHHPAPHRALEGLDIDSLKLEFVWAGRRLIPSEWGVSFPNWRRHPEHRHNETINEKMRIRRTIYSSLMSNVYHSHSWSFLSGCLVSLFSFILVDIELSYIAQHTTYIVLLLRDVCVIREFPGENKNKNKSQCVNTARATAQYSSGKY